MKEVCARCNEKITNPNWIVHNGSTYCSVNCARPKEDTIKQLTDRVVDAEETLEDVRKILDGYFEKYYGERK